ncbi:Zn-dependent amino-or carboxypeptidase, M28 family [Hymenobacter daecheongensis DSM 21074]|uniref:Zn-dependent amino-or carboxypeptidase, M28 family n=1 Tax=Hymenobacter daecheongensis DSM 21074 TaxID=1121955 RepID=A0A1M6A876_9BACT|nr:M28 family peptidase [Hymenobacter daecheongensis]SHI32650.1 Zn-dependent amino-or carboxypeptidase, M28 family [Hymenobacter daecheongensis DSM 21074]
MFKQKHPFYALLLAACCATSAVAQQVPEKSKIKVKRGKAEKTAPAPVAAPLPTRQPPIETDMAAEYGATITQDDLRRHLTILASDAYEGRETGEKGQKMAADYLAKEFAALDLTGPVKNSDNPFVQHFSMERSTWAEGATLKVAGQTYKWLADFYGMGSSPFQTEATVKPVFLGYGIEQDGYSDYAGKDVKGKDVIILLGEPTTTEGKALLSADGKATKWGTDFRAKAVKAAEKGVRSVFFVNPDPQSNFEKMAARMAPYLSRPSMRFLDSKDAGRSSFFVSAAVGYKLLGTTAAALSKYQATVAKAGKPVVAPFKPAAITIKAPKKKEEFTTENVMGFLEGSDKRDEVLVISAHYDHIGITNGEVNNGADDDGSGTVSVLELAQAFAKAKREGHGPRRSILFLTVTGEEKGLLGSEYYTDHPVLPLENTIADLNIDMVGRTDKEHEGKPDYVYVIGSDKLSSELHAINEEANKKYTNIDLDYKYNDPEDPNRFYYRSDHYNFAKHKIPVAFFFNGVHDDYHGAGDEVEKIEFGKMEKRARLVFHTAWELVNRDTRIVVDSNKP